MYFSIWSSPYLLYEVKFLNPGEPTEMMGSDYSVV